MVFESYVVDLVNKFGGQFLENLDPSQLKLGIWGGDAKLENLILKESALDDFDLPVKVLRGHLGKLVLKIPWKNLYSEPVVAKIDGLYLLVRPNTGIKYNAEKEEKAEQEKKKRQLDAVELARKLEDEKKKAVSDKKEKGEKEGDGFVEKLAMQVVKNLQIYISNIHVRYEDTVSNPSAPFSIGITLENLSAQTTDENWLPHIADQTVRIVHKLVELNSLSVYWNTNDKIGELPSQSDWVNIASNGIAKTIKGNYKPANFKYVLQPISATSKLKLDTKPGSDLSSPKVYLGLVLEEIFLNLTKQQYHNIMELLDSFDYMSRNIPYRKYKPNVKLPGNAGKWWRYAIDCILQEDVKRRHKNWSWKHMKEHRTICKEYKELYKKKLLQDKLSKEEQKNLEALEEKLDVLNITICRQRAEFEEAAALRKKKRKAEEKSKEGYFSGWFGSSKKKKSKSEEQSAENPPSSSSSKSSENARSSSSKSSSKSSLPLKFISRKKSKKFLQEILTEEQKQEELQKLYAAIGYSENDVITAFPKDYVENQVIIHLRQIGVVLRDVDPSSKKTKDIVRLSIQDLYADLAQRPSAQAIKVTTKIDQMRMFGATSEHSKYLPLMITSQHGKEEHALALFNAAFETNPLDEKCDQRLTVKSQPLKIVYDAFTIDKVVDFFQPPKGVQLQELSAVAISRLEELKTASKASLAYAVEHHKVTDINVDVMSPYIIIPEKGRFEGATSLLVVDLGHLKITSDPEQERVVTTKDLSISELESKCYDKFDIRLEALQVLIAKKDDAWDAACHTKVSKLHVIDPMELDLKLQKALNPDDIRLAQIKIAGNLHAINVHITDKKLEQVMKLALSIPIPGSELPTDVVDAPPEEQLLDKGKRMAKIKPISTGLLESSPDDLAGEDEEFQTPPEESVTEAARLEARKTLARQVQVALTFEIEEVCVSAGFEDNEGNETPCMAISLGHLGTVLSKHQYDIQVSASIGSLAVKEMGSGLDGEPVYLIQTPKDTALLSINVIQADQESPEYYTTFLSTEKQIMVDFTSLSVLLHQEALLRLMDFSSKLIPAMEENEQSLREKGRDIKGEIKKHKSKSEIDLHKKGKKKARSNPDNILVDVKAKMGGISVIVTSKRGDIASILVGGLSAHVKVLDDKTNVTASMKDLSVMDTTQGVLYPNIVSIVNQEVFNVEVVVYNDAMEDGNYTNMEIVDTSFKMDIGCIKVIFLNKFTMELLAFLNNFQKAKEAMQQATITATEKAAIKMQDLQQQTSRIKLAVSIQAPLIIIPVSSSSRDVLVADLGLLNVSNSFKLHQKPTKPDGSDAVIVDDMVVELTSVKLSRGSITKDEELQTGSVIIEPITMAIYLSRNLSPWFHGIPDVNIHGKLNSVKLCASEGDIATLMAVVFQNLAEGPTEEQTDETDGGISDEIVPVTEASLEAGTPDKVLAESTVWDTVKFDFEIEKVSASVYWNEPKEPGPKRDPSCCLGKFSIVSVKTSGRMTSNMALDAVVSLETCVLDDKRPESEQGVMRMMDRFLGDSRHLPNMIDVKYEQSPNQDKNISIDINNIHIVANLEFIIVLASVFTSALESAPPRPAVESNIHLPDVTQAVALVPATLIKPVEKEPPSMRLQFALRQPEIVLLADAKDKNTHALFMKNTIDFNMMFAGGQQKMFAHLSNLSITSAAFDMEHRDATKTQVFYLSQLALHSSAPEGQSMHIDIRTSVAHIHVSPPSIRTITACLMSLAPAKDTSNDKSQHIADTTMWTENAIEKKEKWYLTPVQQHVVSPGVRIYGRWPKTNKYYPGYIAKIDTRVKLKFDNGDETMHDVNDLTAIVLDTIPNEKDLKCGTKVIAPDLKATQYFSCAVIRKIEEKGGKLVYHVDYKNGKEGSYNSSKLRKLTVIKPGVSEHDIVPSSIVFVRQRDGKYVKGFVSSKRQRLLIVKAYQGPTVKVNANNLTALVLDKVPQPGAIQIGMTVLGKGKDPEFWHMGKVYQIKKEDGIMKFNVVFDNDVQLWLGVQDLRIVTVKRRDVLEGTIEVGSSVWAWWSGNSYYPGYLSYKGTKLHVDFFDGQKRLYNLKDALINVLPDTVQNVRDVHQGARVISTYKNSRQRFSGVIDKVDKSREKFRFYHVKFDGGDDEWVRLFDLQFLPKDGITKDEPETSPEGWVLLPKASTVTPKHGDWELVDDASTQFKSVFKKEKKSLVKSDSNGAEVERGEMLLFNMEGFNVKMEGMFGGQVIPLLSMDGHVQAEVKDWSSKLEVTAGLSLIANYFNENISEWEPLIEPVEESTQKYRQWELSMELSMASDVDGDSEESSGGGLDVNVDPAMSLAITSKDTLQVTITKTSLDVFNKLASAFGEAVSLEGGDKIAMEDLSPYVIRNEIGLGIKVYLGKSLKGSSTDEQGAAMFAIASGRNLPLYLTKDADRRASRRVRNTEETGLSVSIEVEGYHTAKDIPIKQARVAFYTLVPRQLLKGTMMAMVVQVESGEGQKAVTIRSPLQIFNHFPIPLDLSCKRESQSSKITSIPAQTIYNVPLVLAYRAGLHLKPSGFGYNETSAAMMWTQLKSANGARFMCNSQLPGEAPFYIQVVCQKAEYTVSQGVQDSSPVYIYHVYPSAVLHNYLPYNIHYSTEGIPFVDLKGGENCALYSVNLTKNIPLNIQIDDYLGESWRGEILLKKGMNELSAFTLIPVLKDSDMRPVELGVFTQMDGALNITIYSPYWMVNKTGMFLEYLATDDDVSIGHPDSHRDAVMFSYKRKGNVFSKKAAAKIRLSGSEWCSKFSLDTVGSGGSMKLKRQGKIVEIGVQISLSYFSLTKIVEFTPFHLLKNQFASPVYLCEAPDDSYLVWTKVEPGECVPFWPSSVPPKNLVIRVGDDMDNSPRFNFQPETTVLLRMADKVGAVCVEMVSKESAAIMTFIPYYNGAAPVRIENSSPLEIHYKQDSQESRECLLHPGHSILYTWDKLMEKKSFIWWAEGEGDKKRTTDLTEATHSSFKVNDTTYYWATFLDGLQRVLLIIDDFTLAYRAQLEIPERVSQSIKLDLHGFGLSLVNNETSIELAYVGITESDIVWEELKSKGRWKGLKLSLSQQLEEAWNHVQHVNTVGGEPNYRKKMGDIEVDFELMEIISPSRRPIRRTFTPGISVQYEASPHELTLHTKVNAIQIDSQIPGSTFRTVLHPVPPPKSVAADNAPKPFFEMSLVMRQVEHSQVNEIKYFMVLIQEMEVMIDMGFIMALVELFSSDTIDRSKELSQYTADKQRVLDSLGDANAVQAALDDKRNYFDTFHLSPLKIHVSFSQLGGPSKEDKDKSSSHIGNSFINLLMQSVGVAVTEVQDVEFKLAYFEISNQVYDQQQLVDVIRKHYTSQAIKQMYVLVLGLDVLGNPFGLISGLKDGAKDLFYEPYQGFIQGPGEFAEGLALGVRSLVGHTVGGAAGAVSRITGTLGKGIAALTMDEKYQQERRQAMGKKPVNVGEGLARGGKGLIEGVLDGVTGIVTKPVEGAKQQGAAGFFKGVGKGLVGVVARPAGGIVDFASSTLEGIKGTADNQAELHSLRPPRVFYADKVIKPYNLYEATGNDILEAVKTDESSLADDRYFAHRDLNIKKALLITNKHIVVAGKAEVFGNWECDWICAFADLTAEPTTDKHKIVLSVPDKGRVLFKRSETRAITTPSPQIAQWFVKKIKEARA